MTLTIQLEPEEEQRILDAAKARGIDVQQYARELLTAQAQALPRREPGHAYGKYAHVTTSSDQFAARKREEKVREDRHQTDRTEVKWSTRSSDHGEVDSILSLNIVPIHFIR